MRRATSLLVAVVFVSCTWNTLDRQEIETMKAEFVLRYGGQPALWPVMAGMREEIDIFSVPVENAVGTNSINNAITLLRFDKDRIEHDEIRRNFIEGVGSGDKYYSDIFSDRWIGYTQTRGLLLFGLKDRSFADHNDSTEITAHDMNFSPVAHPFCDLLNGLKDFRCLDQLTIHPALPIAVLVEINQDERSDYKVYLANRGNPDPEKRFIELIAQDISILSGRETGQLGVSDF
jgi:hypothetical protein